MPSNHPFKPRGKAASKKSNDKPVESSDEAGEAGVVPGGGDPAPTSDEPKKKRAKKKTDAE